MADPGVDYTLQSAEAMLILGGERLYDLKTAHAYNSVSGEFDSPEYTLKKKDAADKFIRHS